MPSPRNPGRIRTSVPPTTAEAAAAADTWERRGFLGRLVRLGADEAGLTERLRRP